MGKKLSEEQLRANRKNAKKGGIKTPEGKEISKFNAIKHGILCTLRTDYDSESFEDLHRGLIQEFSPKTIIEGILVEKLALYIIRLDRAAKAEMEYMKTVLKPVIGHWEDIPNEHFLKEFDFHSPNKGQKWVIDKPGYEAKVKATNIEILHNIYLRYEKALENRLFRILYELEKMQDKRANYS